MHRKLSSAGSHYIIIFSFVKNGSLTPYVYEISLLFLPPVGELSNLGAEPSRDMVDLLYSMWSLGTEYCFRYSVNQKTMELEDAIITIP